MQKVKSNVLNLQSHRSRLKHYTLNEGHKLSFIDEGEGPAILLIHGVPTSSYLYRKLIPILSSGGFRAIVPDLLGYGNSDKPEGFDLYRSDRQANRLVELMNHLQIESWHHVCHDMGGLVTWELIKKYQPRVGKLTLLNTIIYQEGFRPPIKMKRNLLTRLYTKLYCTKGIGKLIMASTFKNGLSKNHRLTPEELEAYHAPMKEGAHHALFYFFSQTGAPLPDHSPIIDKLDIPVNVVWGIKDKILQWSPQSERLIDQFNMTNDDLLEFSECKHFIQEEKPGEIVQFLRAAH